MGKVVGTKLFRKVYIPTEVKRECQDPKTAEVDIMPKSAIDMVVTDKVIPIDRMGGYLAECDFKPEYSVTKDHLDE